MGTELGLTIHEDDEERGMKVGDMLLNWKVLREFPLYETLLIALHEIVHFIILSNDINEPEEYGILFNAIAAKVAEASDGYWHIAEEAPSPEFDNVYDLLPLYRFTCMQCKCFYDTYERTTPDSNVQRKVGGQRCKNGSMYHQWSDDYVVVNVANDVKKIINNFFILIITFIFTAILHIF